MRDGVKVYVGTGTSFTDADVSFDTTYYYRAYPYNEKKQYQTLTNVVSITPKSWQMPKFTGSGYASGDQKKGMFTCLSSGTLTLDAQTYDVFVVGGGASGKAIPDLEDSYGAAGGGSGYTNTKKGVVYKGGECRVYIGSGGIPIGNDGDTPWCNPGSESSISIGVETVSALGGTVQGYGNGSLYGTNGGSGGGNAGYKLIRQELGEVMVQIVHPLLDGLIILGLEKGKELLQELLRRALKNCMRVEEPEVLALGMQRMESLAAKVVVDEVVIETETVEMAQLTPVVVVVVLGDGLWAQIQ